MMLCESPARPLIGKQIHVQDALASARAKHRRLFLKAVIDDNVKPPLLKFLGQGPRDDFAAIRASKIPAHGIDRPLRPAEQSSKQTTKVDHAVSLMLSSGMPSSGLMSPIPTLRFRMLHTSLSGSGMNSMLDRLKVTLA